MIKKTIAAVAFGGLWGSLIGGTAHAQVPSQMTAVQQFPGRPVSPGLLFPDKLLLVHSPNTEGWVLRPRSAGNGIIFGKRGPDNDESYIASVDVFEIPPTKGQKEFLDYIKTLMSDANAKRFREADSNFQYVDNRGYPCVKVVLSGNDNAATTPVGKGPLKMQIVALYCRHPAQQQLGFSVTYSHRGSTLDPQMEAPAQSFIDGVTVPNNESNNGPQK